MLHFLGGNTRREQGKKVQIGNIMAAKVSLDTHTHPIDLLFS